MNDNQNKAMEIAGDESDAVAGADYEAPAVLGTYSIEQLRADAALASSIQIN